MQTNKDGLLTTVLVRVYLKLYELVYTNSRYMVRNHQLPFIRLHGRRMYTNYVILDVL